MNRTSTIPSIEESLIRDCLDQVQKKLKTLLPENIYSQLMKQFNTPEQTEKTYILFTKLLSDYDKKASVLISELLPKANYKDPSLKVNSDERGKPSYNIKRTLSSGVPALYYIHKHLKHYCAGDSREVYDGFDEIYRMHMMELNSLVMEERQLPTLGKKGGKGDRGAKSPEGIRQAIGLLIAQISVVPEYKEYEYLLNGSTRQLAVFLWKQFSTYAKHDPLTFGSYRFYFDGDKDDIFSGYLYQHKIKPILSRPHKISYNTFYTHHVRAVWKDLKRQIYSKRFL